MSIHYLFCNECFRKFPEDQLHVRYERDPGSSGTAGGYGPRRIAIGSCPKCRSEWLSDWKQPFCHSCHDEEVDEEGDLCVHCTGHPNEIKAVS